MKVCPIYSLPDQLEIPDKSERFIFISIAAFAHIEHSLKTWWPYLELQFLETIRQGIVNALYHDSVHMNLVVAKYVTDNVLKRGLKYFTKNSFFIDIKMHVHSVPPSDYVCMHCIYICKYIES